MVQGARDPGRLSADLPRARRTRGDTDDVSRVVTTQELLATGPCLGDLVRVDAWVKNMIVDHLNLSDFPRPPYDGPTVARLCRDDVAVVIDVSVVPTSEGMGYDKYYRILGPGGVGWVSASYLESAEIDA